MLMEKSLLIDSHSHIYLDEFHSDRPEAISRAKEQGISKILMPAIDSTTHQQMMKVEEEFAGVCVSMMGLHPCSVKGNFEDELSTVRNHLETRNFIAIGEIGLDFYWDKTFLDQQYMAFDRQIDWALEMDLPIVIHSRDAIDECIEVVSKRQNGSLKGVFHCFGGSLDQAKAILGLGFYLGIGGVLTFKKAGLDKVLESIDLEHVILETDAPYLAPVPYRGKRNESSYLSLVARNLANVKEMQYDDVARITSANTEKLFRLNGN